MFKLVVSNRRGFNTLIKEKPCFPDRSCTDIDVGICDVESVKDKGTYGFFKGEMLEKSRVGTLEDALELGLVNLEEVLGYFKLGDYFLWELSKQDYDGSLCIRRFYSLVDGSLYVFDIPMHDVGVIRNYLRDISWCGRAVSLVPLRQRYLDMSPLEDYVLEECIIRSLHIKFPNKIWVFGGRIVEKVSEYGSSFYYCDGSDLVPYDGRGVGIPEDYTDRVREAILTHRVSLNGSKCCREVFGEIVTAEFISNESFSYAYYVTVKGKLQKNIDYIESVKKWAGKNISSKNISELCKLNFVDFQLG